MAEDFNQQIANDYGIDYNGPTSTEDNAVVIPRVNIELTESGNDELHEVDVLQESDNCACDIFLRCVISLKEIPFNVHYMIMT